MKKIVPLLLCFVTYCGFAQNPSDLDPSFNIIAIPEARHCMDYFAPDFKSNAVGNMILESNDGISYIDGNQNLLNYFEIGGNDFTYDFDGLDKLLILNHSGSLNGNSVPKLIRLNLTTGIIDNSFTLDPAISFVNANGKVKVVNNKIYLQAGSMQVNGVLKTIVRLNLDGSLDSTYNYSGSYYEKAFIMDDGTVFLNRDQTMPRVIKLLANGAVDSNFSTGIVSIVQQIRNAGDGNFYFQTSFNDGVTDIVDKIIKVSPDGSFVSDFTVVPVEYEIANWDIQSDYKIVFHGANSYNPTNYNVYRLLTNGNFDPTFTDLDIQITNIPVQNFKSLTVINDKIYLSNLSFHSLNGSLINKIIRLNANGSFDQSFVKPCKSFVDGYVVAVEEQLDGKLLVSGTFNFYNGVQTKARFIRLNNDGSIDLPFLNNLGKFVYPNGYIDANSSIKAIKVMPDGKILVAGGFRYEALNGQISTALMVLNQDGTLFKNYTADTNGSDYHIELQSDGRPIIVGDVAYLAGANYDTDIIRLNADYNADTTFPAIIYFNNNTIFTQLEILSDNTFLVSAQNTVGGNFKKYTADGILVPSFVGQTSNHFEVRSDGKIINHRYNATATPLFSFERLSSNGAFENTLFQLNNILSSFLYESNNNKITFITGDIIKRFFSDGIVDPSFEQKLFKKLQNHYAEQALFHTLHFLSDGRIAVATSADLYNGVRIGKLAILLGSPELKVVENIKSLDIKMYPNPVENIVTITSKESIDYIELYDLNGRLLARVNVNDSSYELDISHNPAGMYLLKATSGKSTQTLKIIK